MSRAALLTLGDYTLNLTISDVWLSFLILAVVVFLAIRAYRPADVGSAMRALFSLRIAVILLAVLLLSAPKLTVSENGVRLPLLAVLIDDSESMRIAEGDRSRYEIVTDLETEGVIGEVSGRARVQTYHFSESLVDTLPDPRWRGAATDVSTALNQLTTRLQGEGLAGILLVSDGAHNLGESPLGSAEDLGTPIYSVLVGDEEPPRDVSVTSVALPSLGYVGRRIDVVATVEAVGLDRAEHSIRLYDGEELVSVTPLVVSSGTREVTVPYTPAASGDRSLRLEVPAIDKEAETQNNQVLSRIEILDGRARVMLLGTPSDDCAFVRRLVEADSNVALTTVFPDTPQGWGYRAQAALEQAGNYDLLILHDIPTGLLSPALQTSIADAVTQGGALLLVGGENLTTAGLSALGRALPVLAGRRGYTPGETFASPGSHSERHPIMRFSEDAAGDRESWGALPPLVGSVHLESIGEPGSVLLESESGDPIAAVANSGRGKVAVFGGRGFSRQSRMMSGIGNTDEVVTTFWRRTVRWLLTSEEVAKLRVSTEKETYRSGEPIRFRAEFYDDLLRPVDGAEVLLDIEDGRTGVSVVPGSGGGVYEVRVPGLPQGVHTYSVTAQPGDGQSVEFSGEVTVGRYSVEFENLLADASLMTSLSRRSGGRTVDPDSLVTFLRELKLSPQPHVSVARYELWGRGWPLAVLVIGLAAEWLVRRRRGMV